MIVILILLFLAILAGILVLTSHTKNTQKTPLQSVNPMKDMKASNRKGKKDNKQNIENLNYIKPGDFSVGPIIDKPYKTANLCNPDVLYPTNQLGVDYGSKMPNGCPCAQYIQAP